MTPERKEEIKRMMEEEYARPDEPYSGRFIANAPQAISDLLAALEEAQQQAEKHRKVAEAKVIFTNQGNNDYVYGLQEDLIEAQQTIARQQKVIEWYESGGSMGELVSERGETQP